MIKKAILSSTLLVVLSTSVFAQTSDEWLMWAGDLLNHHHRIAPQAKITKETVKNLRVKWEYQTTSSVFGIPTSKDGIIYFGDIGTMKLKEVGIQTPKFHNPFVKNKKPAPARYNGGGYLYALDTQGNEVWKKAMMDYFSDEEKAANPMVKVRNISRVSPAIGGDLMIVGTSINYMRYIWDNIFNDYKKIPGATVMAINRHTGKLVWSTEVDSHFSARITSSPVIYKNQVFVGVSSEESQIPGFKGAAYPCCEFRGSLVSLDLATGKINWKTHTISDEAYQRDADGDGRPDFNGAAVWGSSFSIDEKRGRIYFASGNNYKPSAGLRECMGKAGDNVDAQKTCVGLYDHPGNLFDAIIAANLKTGKIEWSFKSQIFDAWHVGCGSPLSKIPPRRPKSCPSPFGVDSDFGQAPMLLLGVKMKDGTTKDLVVDGNKAGHFYAIDADTQVNTPTPVWHTYVAGGGALGGHEWGSATDGKTIYTQSTNLEHKKIKLTRGKYTGKKNHKTIHGGFWSALDAATGDVVWQTPDPANEFPLKDEGIRALLYGWSVGRGQFASPIGPLTLYNDIIFAGSLSGHLHALDSKTGEILWDFDAGEMTKSVPEYYTRKMHKKEVKAMNRTSAVSAPAIINDQLFWGLGYPLGTEDNRMISLGL